MDVPNCLKPLLMYKLKTVCHSRWITTASGYLLLFLFHSYKLCVEDMTKLTQIVSYVVSMYIPSFTMIHFMPKACDGPFLTLFQKDLVLAYQKIDEQVANIVFKYFVENGSQWLSLKNVALSLISDIPPLSRETEDFFLVACCYRYFCAPSLTYSDIIPAMLWKSCN